MLWTIDPALSCSIDQFVGYTPSEVLYEFEGPRIFTTVIGSHSYLWYECGEDLPTKCIRYLVVPANRRLIEQLKSGSKTVHDALRQPWLWTIDVKSGAVVQGWVLSDLDSVPADAKPNPDTPLWPQLVPLLSYRLIGDGLREGEIPASVVTRAVSGPIAALKALIEVVNNASTTIGRPDEESRKLYDVVAKRFAYNSFEIAFDLPLSQEGSEHTKIAMPATLGSGSNITPASTTISIQSNFPEVPSAHHFEFDRHLKLYQEGAVKLNRALEWLMTDDDLVVPPTLGMLTVLENLVPPKHGQITAAEIKGKLIGASSSITLTRDSTNKVRRAIADSKERQRTLVTLEGRIGEFDKDKLICTLRDRSDHSADTVCSFSEAHYDDLYDAFNTDKHVVIHGRWPANRRVLEIVAEEIVETPRIS